MFSPVPEPVKIGPEIQILQDLELKEHQVMIYMLNKHPADCHIFSVKKINHWIGSWYLILTNVWDPDESGFFHQTGSESESNCIICF